MKNLLDRCYRFSRALGALGKTQRLATLVCAGVVGFALSSARAQTQDGALRMEVITAYNFVVDSNIETPAGKSPSAAHLGVKIYNDGATALTNVVVNIGDFTNPVTSTGAGSFESRIVNVSGQYAGTFSLVMPGGAGDAVRVIPRIEPGQSVVQYFFVTYPLKDGSGNSVTGAASVPEDDLWLKYDIWAYATDGLATLSVDKTNKVTMRNEISAMANKIWPNGDNKVPNEYLDVIETSLGWRPSVGVPRIPGANISEGIWYDLGNIGAGFDNNGDGIPDRNAWLQPVGDPSKFSPLAARLVKCYGLVIVKLNDGTEQLIPFEDRLYFENMLANNTGAVGLVFYEFLPLNSSLPSSLTPYQEVASGYDNEKFNADYGTVTGTVATENPTADIQKTGPSTIAKGSDANYSIVTTNTGTVQFGWPDLGVPVVIEDPIPAGLQYVINTADTASNVTSAAGDADPYDVYYSIDNGATWSTSQPSPASLVNRLRWVLDRPLAPNQTATVQFSATVPSGFTGSNFTNTAILKLGTESEIDRDDWPTTITGNNSIGDFVWRDLNRDGLQTGEAAEGIVGVDVSLYVDTNNNQSLDSGEPLYATTSTGVNGAYLFSSLPDGRYIAVVNATDPQLPTAYTLKAGVSDRFAIDLDSAGVSGTAANFLTADWPFIQGLEVTKTVSPIVYNEGDLITYDVHLDNHMQTLTLPVTNLYTVYANSTVFDKTNAADKINEAKAAGVPNSQFAFLDWNANSDRLVSTGVTPAFTLPGGSAITKVELIVRGYQGTPLTDDQMQIEIGHSDRAIALLTTRTTAQMNALVGVSQDLVIDLTTTAAGVTPGWTAAEINSLSAALVSAKSSGGDNGDYNVDSIGFRVTTNNVPFTGSGGPNTIAVWPLKDTYDPTKLAFVSASVSPDVTTPAGTLEWFNLGPVNAGARRSITVTFRALSPTDTTVPPDGRRDPMLANNFVTTLGLSTGDVPLFQTGRSAGHDDGTVDVTINPSGRIGDFVYWDINANGTYNPPVNGVFTDIPLQGVIVRLFQGGVYSGRSQITDANGFYEFTGLADGTYEVRITTDTASDLYTLPWIANPVTSTQRGTVATTVTSNTFVAGNSVVLNNADFITTNDTNLLQDFGFDTNAASVIAGTLFRDWDGDGFQDPGDEPLVGFTVTLTGTNARTTTTDANGNYLFTNLTSTGNSTVTVTPPPPATNTQTLDPDLAPGNTGGNNATTVNVALGNAYLGRNFAYRPTGALTIGDTLYYDWNGNATQNAGEGGIPNVTVRLYQDENGDGAINVTDSQVASADTNASGFYQFTGLATGNYIVAVDTEDPDFPATSIQTQDFDTLLDNNATVNLTVSLNTLDFGYQPIGSNSIGNLVWLDADNDGVKDTSEVGINGVTVQLFRSDQTPGVSTPYLITTTSGGGFYSFSSLPAGSYYVYIAASNFGSGQALVNYPWSSTTTVTADNQQDNDDNGAQSVLAGATTSPLIALSAESDQTIDFGFTGAASIGDIVFYDLNGNGNLDYTETGINGVIVELYLDADQNGVEDGGFIATTVTVTLVGLPGVPDVSGFYEFTGLAPNTYIVKVRTSTLPAGLTQTSDPDLDGIPVNNLDGDPNNNGDHADIRIILFSGSAYTGADFGYQPPGSIGDYVWLDVDRDGVQDAGEPGIAGVVIRVTNGTTTYDITTDTDGLWAQTVANGNWAVSVLTPPSGRVNTYDADSGIISPNASVAITVSAGVVTVPSGLTQGNMGLDFGYALNGAYSLSGTVAINDDGSALPNLGKHNDVDDFINDGTDFDAGPNDETELANVLVYLYSPNGTFLGSTYTDADGNYQFTNLPDGGYRVIIGTTTPPLDRATLNTTNGNYTNGTTVTNTGTTVIQNVTIAGASLSDIDFMFDSTVNYDFGDLPASYGITGLAQDGARHIVSGGPATLYLGTNAPDVEINGTPSLTASSDDTIGIDDDDGVTFNNTSSWVTGANVGAATVKVTGSGYLVAWIDWNNDGDFLDDGEMIANQTVSSGDLALTINIPANYTDYSGPNPVVVPIDITGNRSWLSRFRLFPSAPAFPAVAYVGEALGGEVEDHLVQKTVGGSIGDIVWIDSNGDGLLNGLEVGLGGVRVELRDASNAFIVFQNTSNGSQDVDNDGVVDPVGYYRFIGRSAATYNVVIPTPPVGYTLTFDDEGALDSAAQVILGSNVQYVDADFGYEPLRASIAGQVRYDLDSDGNLADVDPGATSVTIQLWTDPNADGNPSDGVQVGETSTDSSGLYSFTNVSTGSYVVVEINPDGTTSTADVDSGNFDRITVAMVGVNITGRDFLDTAPPVYLVTIGDFVFSDANANGQQDVEETGLNGITVTLYRLGFGPDGISGNGDDATAITSTTTAGGGTYSFSSLPPGTYQLNFGAFVGYSRTLFDQGADATDSDANSITGQTADIVLAAGATTNTIDAGYYQTATLTGHLYIDTNGDGNQDVGEPNLVGVDVLITDVNNAVQTVTTDANGDWTASVPPGSTSANINEADPQYPTGYTQTEGTDPTVTVAVAGASTNGGTDGFYLSGTLTGHLYIDTNGDGNQDVGEPNLVGVDVLITDVNNAVQIVTTDSNGDWTATVPPGNTSANIDETDTDYPAGYTQTEGTDPTTTLAVAGASTNGGIDGFYLSGTLTGHLYIDTNGDGNQDVGELDLVGVDVIITDVNNAVQTVTTDSSGNWTATVPPGSTSANIDETDTDYPAGYAQTEGTDPTTTLAVAGASTNGGIDGFYQSATLTGHLYIDTNGDGNQDVGELDLVGVDVIITDVNNAVQTVTTDSSGNWTATVPPGSTSANIDETDTDYPAGYAQTEGTDPTTTLAVAGASTNGGIDGFYQSATLTGHLYIDTNGDGNQDVGEPNLANVDVLITDVNNTVQTVTTDSNGDWTATVPPGNTSANIDETDTDYPAGYAQTEGTDPTTTLAVAGASTNGGIDGFYQSATLTGHLYIDTNGDGNQDVGEPNLANVDVLITDVNNTVQTVTTDSNGDWTATVPPGNTSANIDETDTDYPTGYAQTEGTDPTTTLAVAGASTNGGTDGFAPVASIAGNVFNDQNRLDDDIINGVGTNAGGIYINLVDPSDNTVLASLPVNADGTYLFAAGDGVEANGSYLLILTPQLVTVGAELTVSALPIPWFSTGETIGTASGNDGTVNGILAVTTTVGALEQANFGIVQAPDVTPVITAQPNVMNGVTDFNIRVQVVELHQVATEGSIIVRIPKDARWTLREAYDTNLITLDGVAMENNKWAFSENATQYVFTTVNSLIVIPAGGFSTFGIKARWASVAQEGIYTVTVQVDSFSGKEIPINNNSDAEKIDYFDK